MTMGSPSDADELRALRVSGGMLADLLAMARERAAALEVELANVRRERDEWERRYREVEAAARGLLRTQ